jgi:hypothetical protein
MISQADYCLLLSWEYYFYGAVWAIVIVLCMVAGIAGGAIASYSSRLH